MGKDNEYSSGLTIVVLGNSGGGGGSHDLYITDEARCEEISTY